MAIIVLLTNHLIFFIKKSNYTIFINPDILTQINDHNLKILAVHILWHHAFTDVAIIMICQCHNMFYPILVVQ